MILQNQKFQFRWVVVIWNEVAAKLIPLSVNSSFIVVVCLQDSNSCTSDVLPGELKSQCSRVEAPSNEFDIYSCSLDKFTFYSNIQDNYILYCYDQLHQNCFVPFYWMLYLLDGFCVRLQISCFYWLRFVAEFKYSNNVLVSSERNSICLRLK